MARSADEICAIKMIFGKEIGLSIGFDGLRDKLKEWGEDKEWNARGKEYEKNDVDEQLPQIFEGGNNKTASSIDGDLAGNNIDLSQDEMENEIRLGGKRISRQM